MINKSAFNCLFHQIAFEKWCAIRASVGGMRGVLAWVPC